MRRVLLAFAAAALCLGAPVSAFAQDPVVVDSGAVSAAPLVDMGTVGTADLSGCRLVPQADYMHWWVRNISIPPIVTTGDSTVPRGGALNQEGTSVLYGDRISYNDGNGGRFGLLLEGDHMSYDVSYFNLSPISVRFNAVGNGSGPVLAVPFNSTIPNPNPNGFPTGESVFAVANPAVPATGAITVSSKLELWGVETNAYWNWRRNDAGRTDFLLGFRYIELKNDFLINAQSTNPNETLSINDTFQTENHFYGIQIGGKTHQHIWGNLNLDVSAKLALGVMDEQIDIHGIRTAPGFDPQFSGFFANSGNSGNSTSDVFAAVPQVQVRLSYDVCSWFRVYGGYEFLYISSVAMAGEQINRNVNPSFIPNPNFGPPVGVNSPTRNDKRTDFMANGLTFGFELSF
jgi:Putative beta barrel porin-7 (BBP7)